jgi:hypothetical protein
MWKSVIAGATVLSIAGGSLVYAQQRPHHGMGPHPRPTAEDISAYSDARIAGLKAGLHLTAEQEKNWPALEKALRDSAKQRAERFAARASADKPADPIERLRLHADQMSARGASLKEIADAAGPLYKSLDEGQKRRFMMLAHLERRGFGHWRHQGGRFMHGPRGERGGPDQGPGAPDAPRPQ